MFSSSEKEDKKQKWPNNNIFRNTCGYSLNTFNFVDRDTDYLQISNSQNVKKYTNFSALLKTKKKKNDKIPSDLLTTQEKKMKDLCKKKKILQRSIFF
jgi:hypothetical protein